MNRAIRTGWVAVVLWGAAAAPARGQDFSAVDPAKLKFTYLESDRTPAIFVSRGSYWVEFAHGREYRFDFEGRTAEYVELKDRSRDLTVRLLFNAQARWKVPGGDWHGLGAGTGTWGVQQHRK